MHEMWAIAIDDPVARTSVSLSAALASPAMEHRHTCFASTLNNKSRFIKTDSYLVPQRPISISNPVYIL